jgi:hypothetical protein
VGPFEKFFCGVFQNHLHFWDQRSNHTAWFMLNRFRESVSAAPDLACPASSGMDESIPGGGIENPLNFQDVFTHSPALIPHTFSFIFGFKEKRG